MQENETEQVKKHTIDVINLLENVDQKHLHTFTIFDIKHFYPLLEMLFSLLWNTRSYRSNVS